jgi:uncharacterized protein
MLMAELGSRTTCASVRNVTLAVRAELIDAVDGLHRAIDENARALAEHHSARMQCKRGCNGCCSDGLTVFEVEAAAIVRKHGELLEHGAPHAEGRCAFLDAEGACRVYDERPYVCRTQGLPIRWIEGDRELRDICTLNVIGSPVEELPREQCWPIGPVEARLAAMQTLADGGAQRRVSLRSLFKKS